MSERIDLKKNNQIFEIFPNIDKDLIIEFCKEFGLNIPSKIDVNNLPKEIENTLNNVLILKSLNTKNAIKMRFLQYLKYSDNFNNVTIKDKNFSVENLVVDIVLENRDQKGLIWVFFVEYLNTNEINQYINKLSKILETLVNKKGENSRKVDFDEIYFICGKIERQTALKYPEFKFNSKTVPIYYFIEFIDDDRPFSDTDVLQIDDIHLKGFNFGTLDDLLDAIKMIKGKGKYVVIKESENGLRNKIWEGLILPYNLINKNKSEVI